MKNTTRLGPNDECSCGSGRKYKRCCKGKHEGRSSRATMMLIGAVVVGSLLAVIAGVLRGSDSTPGRVWSPEHGHFHDASGMEIP